MRQTYSHLSDRRLDQLVQEITAEFPSAGLQAYSEPLVFQGVIGLLSVK